MTARSLFNIILKVLGIYFIKDIISSIPYLLSVVYSFGDGDVSGGISVLLISLLTMLVYIVISYLLVLRTGWVMEKLRLLEEVPEDPIPLNIHRSTVVSISLLIVAIMVIVQAIPLLVKGFIKWYQYNQFNRGMFDTAPFDYSNILVYAAEIVIGLLLIGYQQPLVNYIELKTRRQKSD